MSSTDTCSTDNGVEVAWRNHVAAFETRNISDMMEIYDENCVLTIYNQTSGEKEVFEGSADIREDMCKRVLITDDSDIEFPLSEVSEKNKMVFVVWRNVASGILDATTTMVFNDKFKVSSQYLVIRMGEEIV